MIERLEKSKWLFAFINVCAGGYFLLVNYLTPLAGDDLVYQNIYGTAVRVRNISVTCICEHGLCV